MALSNDLISQFVKVTNDTTKINSETTIYGTAVEYENQLYVKLDGSEQLTPITSTADAKSGERVTVLIKDHTATITGNISSPSARTDDVRDLGTQIEEFDIILADKVSTSELEAETARIDTLVSDNVTIKERLTATEADIGMLEADNVTIKEKLTANQASIENLEVNKLDAEIAKITYAEITDLEATNANIHNLEADYGDFKKLTTDNFTAANAAIDNLETKKLDAESAKIIYANIDFANITEAAVQKIFADSGIIKDLVVSGGYITGELVGVTIKGDLIEGGTVIADKLVIKGSDGLYYKLNTDGVTTEAEQTDYNSLNGSVITAKSITATKISVDDLVAFDATIGGFNITDSALYSGVKSSVGNTTTGVYLDKTGQVAFGDASNFVKYFKDIDGSWKLAISASSITFGSSKTNVETIVNNLQTAVNTAQSSANTAQTDANALKTRMTSAETAIEQNAEDIALRATKTEVTETLGGYYTKKEADAAIKLSATNITSSVAETYTTKTEFNNLEVGGRNYVKSLSDETATTYGITVDRSGTDYHIYGTNTKTDANHGLNMYWLWLIESTIFEPGEVYTLSTSEPLPTGIYLGLNTHNSSGIEIDSNGYLFGDGSTKSVTFTWPSTSRGDANGFIGAMYNCGTVDVTFKIKLEKGNRATDWTPAPEDLATNIDLSALTTRVSTAETNITQNTNDITLRATKTEVSTAKSEAISTAASDATAKANNALASAKSYADSQITVSANSITSTVAETYATQEALNTTNDNVTTAQSTADMAKSSAETNSSTIEQLSDSVTTSFTRKTEEIIALQNSVNGLTNDISSVDKKVSEVTAWFNQSMDSGGNPVLELGTTANDLSMELSNSQLGFKDSGALVAYINGQKLYITSAEITGQLKFGNYAWIPNGSHMTLRYLG